MSGPATPQNLWFFVRVPYWHRAYDNLTIFIMRIKKIFDESEEIVVSKKELRQFVLNCMKAAGSPADHANQLADILITSDYRGHYSHGLNRLGVYITDVETKACSVEGTPEILKEKGSTAWVDGCNLLGPVVGNFCMDLAIKKAREFGIGWVVAKGSNHFGIAGWYAMRALNEGLTGMAFTNTSPCVFPTRSSEKSLGSNPICMAAPGNHGDSFFLDMASTTVAYGKIEVVEKRGATKIPAGWGANPEGRETRDPKVVLNGGGLLPLGGQEASGGYKGTGLCMMVEILCGIMGGSAYGANIRQWKTTETAADLGQCFVAIDPDCFAPGFNDRLQGFMDSTRNLKPLDANESVLVAGDPERSHMAMCDDLDGIVYKKTQLVHLNELASRLDVPMFKAKTLSVFASDDKNVMDL
uniref:Malate dehydrogenase n=1 Tax=Plectus sambesii TaxID=2011161 RepID=A0A914WA09_9BILA